VIWAISLLGLLVLLIGLKANQADWGGWSVNWIDGWVRLLCRHLHHQTADQLPLPEHGPAIVVANHVSGLDPFILITASRRPLRFLIASEEYHRPILHWLFKAAGCIPVDRGTNPEKALRQALRALKQGEVIALFPHGIIHLDSDPPRPIKAGVVRLATWAACPVIPARIDGVHGEGHTVLAPFIPSRVQLSLRPIIFCHDSQPQACLRAITEAITTPP
jgi:1-acyl-sn-glycerol-3-phosphate acyltransferase